MQRIEIFLVACGLGALLLISCDAPRRVSSPTFQAPTADTYEKVRFLPVWLPRTGEYLVTNGYFWATSRPKGVGSQIYLYSSRTGAVLEQFTRPDVCPAEAMLTKSEREALAAGNIVVKSKGGTSFGWVKLGSVWVFVSVSSQTSSEVSEILKEYRARFHEIQKRTASSVRNDWRVPDALVKGHWDYAEFDNLVSPR